MVFESGSSRLNAFPFHSSKGPWTSPFPDLALLSPPAKGGLLSEHLCTVLLGEGEPL